MVIWQTMFTAQLASEAIAYPRQTRESTPEIFARRWLGAGLKAEADTPDHCWRNFTDLFLEDIQNNSRGTWLLGHG